MLMKIFSTKPMADTKKKHELLYSCQQYLDRKQSVKETERTGTFLHQLNRL